MTPNLADSKLARIGLLCLYNHKKENPLKLFYKYKGAIVVLIMFPGTYIIMI